MSTNPIARVGVTRVTSPNELHQLDEDLAAGRLSVDDYLRRRNELQPGADPDPPSSSSDTADDDDDGQKTNPFPPAFRWEASPTNETTAVMRPVPPDSGGRDVSEATQVVPTVNDHDSERTQIVQASPQAPPPFSSLHQAQQNSYQQDPNQGWASVQADSSAPPWTVSEVPPIAEQQSAWMRQGPESFLVPAERSRTKQVIGITVLAVLLLALVGAGVAYLVSQGSADQAGGGAQTEQPAPPQEQPPVRELPAPPPPNPPPPDTEQALIEAPGQPRAGGGLIDLARLQSDELLPRPVVDALSTAGMTDGVLKASTRGGSTIGMFALTVRDEQAAVEVADAIATVQRNGGLKADQDRAQQGVTVLGTPEDSPSTVYRAVYVLYDRVIFFEVFGPDRSTVLASFDSILEEQVAYAPPTVR